MSELAVTADSVLVLPHTGELINLNDAPAVARHLRELRDIRQKVNEATGILNEALAAYAQRIGTKTLHLEGVGKVTVTGGPGSEVVWDIEVLQGLVDAGLPQDRFNELVTTEVSYRVNSAVAKQIESSGNVKYSEIIGAARTRADKPYRASVR